MRRILLHSAVAFGLCISAIVSAQSPAPAAAAASPHALTGNVSLVSDYRFRGISQTYLGPAIQGGADYSHSGGFYLGNWNSNVASQVYTGGSGIEIDVYGGYRKSLGDFGLDIGYLYYYYPKAEFQSAGRTSQDFDTQEVYLGGSWRWFSLKYSRAVGDYCGLGSTQVEGGYWSNQSDGTLLPDRGGSEGTYYLDLTANVPVGEKLAVSAHVGTLTVEHYGELDYTDWKLGVTYNLKGCLLGVAYVDTDASDDWYYTGGSEGNKDSGAATVLVSVSKSW
ncbi:MAG: TorF family putative porin [Thermoanaerobaculia bacterium]|jgi:uncharacterized protein (TIGR02001 family)